MFDHDDYAHAGYESGGGMGDTSLFDYAASLAAGFIPGVATPLPAAAPLLLGGGSVSDLVPSSTSATITAPSGLKLRSKPNENSSMISLLGKGTAVSIVAKDFPPTNVAPKGWTQVRTEGGQEGYVSTEWLSISTPTSATSGNTSSPLSLPGLGPSKSPDAPSLFDNKLFLIGGGVVAVALAGALLLGGGKKKKGKR